MTRVLLLRHGATASHRGDIPLTAEGRDQAERAGRALAASPLGRCLVLTSTSTRAGETATLLAQGIRSTDPTAALTGPSSSWGLRNPDLYLAGQRVEMVSGAADFSAQVPGLADSDVRSVDFFARFLQAPDRIGYWLHHADPPGEDREQVARRVLDFVASLSDWSPAFDTVACVTHSPVLRAVAVQLLGDDPGEPPHLGGLALELDAGGAVTTATLTASR
jgi:broad specificity phosphatase PhoE